MAERGYHELYDDMIFNCKGEYISDAALITMQGSFLLIYLIVVYLLLRRHSQKVAGPVYYFTIAYMTIMAAQFIVSITISAAFSDKKSDTDSRVKQDLHELFSLVFWVAASAVLEMTMFMLKKIQIILNKNKCDIKT